VAVAASQASVVPLDPYLTDWYPGHEPRTGSGHYYDLIRPFKKSDESDLFFHENLHWSRGVVPGGIDLLEDIVVFTQFAAEQLALPPGKGIKGRFAGVHVYGSQITVDSEWQVGMRAARFGKKLGPYLENFTQIWADYEQELKTDFERFLAIDRASLSMPELRTLLSDAHVYHQRSMAIHFEVMYSLLANYLAFYELNRELGLDPSQAAMYLTGERTTFMDVDEHLWKLSRRARELGVDDALSGGDLHDARQRIEQRSNGRIWWQELEEFLKLYGYRVDELACIELAPWIDDPTPALGNIRTLLGTPEDHNFAAAHAAMIEDRDTATDAARSKIGGGSKLRHFNEALESCKKANFAWWNDEHNFHIDQRSHVPAVWITRELGHRLADAGHLSQPDDVNWVFTPELFRALDGDGSEWSHLRPLIQPRRDYYNEWSPRSAAMPPLLGTIPDSVNDPIMLEIFGLYPRYLDAMRHGAVASTELHGMAASRGVVEGVARVLTSVTRIHEVQAGEILVCRVTTPDWTPVFGAIKGCVCDGGGSLTHAAIVSREYGIPCVVGAATATASIKTGDRIRVDGDRGIVTVFTTQN
jgi:pyruvate,water dikinase